MIPYSTAPLASKGKPIALFADEEIPAPLPDLVLGKSEGFAYQDWTKDRYGQTRKGNILRAAGRYLYELHDVTVLFDPPAWRIMLEPGIYAREPWNCKPDIAEIKDYRAVQHETRPAVFLLHDWNSNYFHRVVDMMPAQWAWPRLDGKVEIYAHDVPYPIRYDRLYYPSFWPAQGYAPGPIDWLRHCFGQRQEKLVDVLYFQRSDAHKRRVINESQVLRAIGKMGYSILPVEGGRFSFEDQVGMSAAAKMVIGPHGAALVNTVFANDAAVIEFLPERYQPPYIGYFSQWAGNRYARLVMPADATDDMAVDLDMLEMALKAMA